MKNISKTALLLLLLPLSLITAGCGGDGGDIPEPEPDTLSHDARPTDWVRVGENIDPFVSLSLTIARPDLSRYEAPADSGTWDEDLMATFVGGTCRGVSAPFQNSTTTAGGIIFMPAVAALTTDDADAVKTVTIRYYCARLRHIFTAISPYPLKNDIEAYGTRTSPLELTWNK